MTEHQGSRKVRVEISPYATTQETDTHNARQLVDTQLRLHRERKRVGDDAAVEAQTVVDGMGIELHSPNSSKATVTHRKPTGEATEYWFDNDDPVHTLVVQEYSVDNEPIGDGQNFGDADQDNPDFEDALTTVYHSIFALTLNIPE